MTTTCMFNNAIEYILTALWLFSIPLFWKFKYIVSKNIERQGMAFIFYFLFSIVLLLIWFGTPLNKADYIPNLVTEFVGIIITVFLVEKIYKYIKTKNEELYGKLVISNFIHMYLSGFTYMNQKIQN